MGRTIPAIMSLFGYMTDIIVFRLNFPSKHHGMPSGPSGGDKPAF